MFPTYLFMNLDRKRGKASHLRESIHFSFSSCVILFILYLFLRFASSLKILKHFINEKLDDSNTDFQDQFFTPAKSNIQHP